MINLSSALLDPDLGAVSFSVERLICLRDALWPVSRNLFTDLRLKIEKPPDSESQTGRNILLGDHNDSVAACFAPAESVINQLLFPLLFHLPDIS